MARVVWTKGKEPPAPRVSHKEAVRRAQLTAAEIRSRGWVGSPGFMGSGDVRERRAAHSRIRRETMSNDDSYPYDFVFENEGSLLRTMEETKGGDN